MENIDVAMRMVGVAPMAPSVSLLEAVAKRAVQVAGDKIARFVTLKINSFRNYYSAINLFGMPARAVEGSSTWENIATETLNSAVAYASIVDVNQEKLFVARSEALAMFNKAIAAEAARRLAVARTVGESVSKEIVAKEANKLAKVTAEVAASNAANAAARGVAEEVDGADVASDRTIYAIEEGVAKCVDDFERIAKDIFLARATAYEAYEGASSYFIGDIKVAAAALRAVIIRGGAEFARAVVTEAMERQLRIKEASGDEYDSVTAVVKDSFLMVSASERAKEKALDEEKATRASERAFVPLAVAPSQANTTAPPSDDGSTSS